MYCRHCGQKLNDDSRFCQNCGAPVEAAPAQPNAQPQKQTSSPAAAPAKKPEKKSSSFLPTLLICIAVFAIYMATSNSSAKKAESEVVIRPTITLTSPERAEPSSSSESPEYSRIFSSMGIVDSDTYPRDSRSFVARMDNGTFQKFELYTPLGDEVSQFEVTFYIPVSFYANLESAEQAVTELFRPCVDVGCAVLYPSYATKNYYVLPVRFASYLNEKSFAAMYENQIITDPNATSISYAAIESDLLKAGYVKK